MTKRVALIKGDGVGPELVDSLLRVMGAIEHDVHFVECDAGHEWWRNNGGDSLIPTETWARLRNSDACLKGPTTTPIEPGSPKSVAVSIRQQLELYANVRPIRTFQCPTLGAQRNLDFVCVREGTEGFYSGLDSELEADQSAISIRKITRSGVQRVARYAFSLAMERGWTRVCSVNKGNILKESDGLYNRVVQEVSRSFPKIKVENYLVDNMAQQLVKNPEIFNQCIILGTNLFMDIISEEASGHIGSIGMVYSGNFGDRYAMFEPAHDSAPHYKGSGRPNPTATILSGALMLDYLGDRKAYEMVLRAVQEVIAEGKYVTRDLGGTATTSEMTTAIAERLS